MNTLESKIEWFKTFLSNTSKEELDALFADAVDLEFEGPSIEDYLENFESQYMLYNEVLIPDYKEIVFSPPPNLGDILKYSLETASVITGACFFLLGLCYGNSRACKLSIR